VNCDIADANGASNDELTQHAYPQILPPHLFSRHS